MRSATREFSTVAGDGLTGEFVGVASHPVATFRRGRVCEEPGCTTVLSVYNSRTRCAAHDFDESLLNFRCAGACAGPRSHNVPRNHNVPRSHSGHPGHNGHRKTAKPAA